MDLVSLRDWAIVILAILAIIDAIVLFILSLMLLKAVQSTRRKLDPILGAVQDTMGNVRGTSSFVSDLIIKPIIRVFSFAAGVRKAASVAAGFSQRKGRRAHEGE